MAKSAVPPNMLTATQMLRAIAAGELNAVDIVSACLDRIAERDGDIAAWVTVNRDHALRAAKDACHSSARGILKGIPFGVKDVIDTAELPTEMGSALYRGYQPFTDASCVAMARAAGAIMLGKTVTAEFAGSSPTGTRNPHNLAHTPGGSSSGSAAAVADYHVPIAYGTQTGGSILRPASFCGVFGYKPTFGAINPVGVKPAAESFDTVGMIARSLDDIALFKAVLQGDTPTPIAVFSTAPVIGICRPPTMDRASEETVFAVEDSVRRLAVAGAKMRDVALPSDFADLTDARATINAYERARSLAFEWRHAKDRMTPASIAVCEKGFQITTAAYTAAKKCLEKARRDIDSAFDGMDAVLAPAVNGEAPRGLDYAGDPHFQENWTMLHTPSLTMPTHRGPTGLPVGIQLIGSRYDDDRLLAAAAWAWAALDETSFSDRV